MRTQLDKIKAEADAAKKRYGHFTSTHEAYGVLAEEVDELLDAIRMNDREMIEVEARQVSAVAYRLACQAGNPTRIFAERSTINDE